APAGPNWPTNRRPNAAPPRTVRTVRTVWTVRTVRTVRTVSPAPIRSGSPDSRPGAGNGPAAPRLSAGQTGDADDLSRPRPARTETHPPLQRPGGPAGPGAVHHRRRL